MAGRTPARTSKPEQYWTRRLATPAFRRKLAAAIAAELRALARQRLGQVVDPQLVRELIEQWDARVVDRAVLAEVAIAANRRTTRRLAGRRESLVDLLDPELVDELEAAIDAGLELTARGREFITALMEREFVRGLFTDIIFTALVSFQRKANPLFGALAARALEDQIKGFIGLFMPMLQAQAIAFAVDRANQRAVLDFARAVARQLLALPIGRYAAAASDNGESLEALLRRAAVNPRLAELARRAALAAWDDVFAVLKTRRLGELLRIEEHAGWLAERAVKLLVPLLIRPGIVALIAAEIDAARAPAPPAPRRRR
ncbi:MAG TPA: hypothetical protein VL049_24315 [Candidatus Dormibacteraeota bacterium]|nr:hypothetical protein [Candidatus Dormibacteraeota bacterium]